MYGIILALIISIGIPVFMFIYACYRKLYIPFLLGVLAFVVSQVMLRIPLLEYLSEHSAAFIMFSVTNPVLFVIILGLSAGVFEELARFVAMRFFMKQRGWMAGFLFGAGHGGIEAVIFTGISAVMALFSPAALAHYDMFIIGGVERFFAIMLHIGFSIIVLTGVVRRNLLYVLLAILLHGFIDAIVGIIPLLLQGDNVLIVIELTVAIFAIVVFMFSLWIKRKGVLQ